MSACSQAIIVIASVSTVIWVGEYAASPLRVLQPAFAEIGQYSWQC